MLDVTYTICTTVHTAYAIQPTAKKYSECWSALVAEWLPRMPYNHNVTSLIPGGVLCYMSCLPLFSPHFLTGSLLSICQIKANMVNLYKTFVILLLRDNRLCCQSCSDFMLFKCIDLLIYLLLRTDERTLIWSTVMWTTRHLYLVWAWGAPALKQTHNLLICRITVSFFRHVEEITHSASCKNHSFVLKRHMIQENLWHSPIMP